MSNSRTNANARASREKITATKGSLFETWTRAVCRFTRLRRDAMVNSPSTTATVMKAAARIPRRRFGRITRHSTLAQPAPSERATSDRVTTSTTLRFDWIARYA